MNSRSVLVRLRADISQYKQGMAQAGEASNQFVNKNKGAFRDLSNGFGLAGLALTGFALDAVRRFARFDQAMSNVQAATEASTGEMKQLSEAALQAGLTTVFSATEAAGAIEELAKAGIQTSDIIGGALTGALNLAAAGELSVADAATYASIAMKQFGLSGKDVGHIADVLAAGAGEALGGVKELGMALKQGGLVAAQTGLTFEETTAALSAFASAGLLGSDAGTALKTMLQRLTPQSAEAQKQFDELGISAYDANGQFVGLTNFAGQLETKMRDLTPQARNAALSVMFGSDAVRSASVLYEEGALGVQHWIDTVNDQGYAAQVAAVRLDNLKGDIGALTGAYDVAMIKMGEGSDGLLRGLTQQLTGVIKAFADLPPVAQSATLAIVGGGGLALLGLAGLARLTVATAETIAAMQTLGLVSAATATKMKTAAMVTSRFVRAAGAIVGVATAVHLVTSSLDDTAVSAEKITNKLVAISSEGADVATVFDGIKRSWYEWDPQGISPYKTPQDAKDWQAILDNLDSLDEGFGKAQHDTAKFLGMGGQAEEFGNALKEVGTSLGAVADVDLTSAQQQFKLFVDAAGGGEKVTRQLLDLMPDYETKLYEMAAAQGVAADETNILQLATGELELAQGALGRSAQSAAESASAQSEAYQEWLKTIAEAYQSFIDLGSAYDGAIEANKAYAESVANATKTSEDSWEDYYDGVSVSAGDYITQLQNQVAAQEAWATNMTDLSLRVNNTMSADMKAAANAMIDELVALGPEGAQQVQLLHDMTDAELANVVDLYRRKGEASGSAFADQIAGTRPEPIRLTADPEDAVAVLNEILQVIDTSTGTITVEGDDGPVTETHEDVVATIDESTGTVSLLGDDGQAITTLNNYTTHVDASSGTVTVKGNDASGRQTTATLTNWINAQGASVKVSANTDAAAQAIERFRQSVANITAVIQAKVNVNPNIGLLPNGAMIARASGGPVFGPGTTTSDSIPAWLSNSEHVLSAREVDGLGGHAEVERLRAWARSPAKTPFADGGAVTATQAYRSPVIVNPTPAAIGSQQVAVSLAGARVVVSIGARQFDGYIADVADARVASHTASQDRDAQYTGRGF